MWEAISANKLRSRILIGLMGALLVALGFSIGMAYGDRSGGLLGAAAALALWFVLWMIALFAGGHLLLGSSGAHEIQKQDAPQLWNVVEEMTIAAQLPRMPKIYLLEDNEPNAFAVGRKPEVAAVAVTSGLLARLNRDELQGVIAHEIGHVRNLDIRFMTTASILLGSIVLIADTFMRMQFYGMGRRRSSRSDDKDNQAAMIFFIIAMVLSILAPIFAQLLYFACSRKREYLADASAALFTRYPDGLASALQKIEDRAPSMQMKNRAVAPLFIINPLQAEGTSLFSTHPPTASRIKILRAMGGRAGLVDYEKAYEGVVGEKKQLIGQSSLATGGSVDARAASSEPETRDDQIQRARGVSDLLGKIGGYTIIPCECGVRIKVPPDFEGESITCPRCGREHSIPVPQA